ncbi:hypothetical protein CFR75_06005 [Komagataeibacter xylinus]|uniref:Uncharacterized protein n=1 Tax=Komagataeibacter xylinus TaxID=28448 RepID=A0A318PUW6_KOMXY|nr:hypothetical protein [Komagataeibacter xylinus]AZV37976.1 hypothetical protein CXP35_03325 [Komagataeibacter xylinus]AZV39901.1 hypothetical protein CXP35_15160 [Komagataeibacter xylinus]PYD57371.1 hypothetical protein CFR75_06005 [Komagataeibacter xylinus]GBQ80587.1 hypothetical protein AA15237_3021 [Komagataeibacter xylinus NBRC 15237]
MQPAPVTGWIDINLFRSQPAWLPAASALLPLTAEQWAARSPSGQAVQGANIVAYPALMAQAQSTYAAANASASVAYTAKNVAIPDDVAAYLKALLAIANGTDITSTALPAAPADLNGTTTAASTATTTT